MSNLLPVKQVAGSYAVSICPRCSKKVYYGDLRQDPNNFNYYCADCVDEYDPYKLPARRAEDISLQHPRPDEVLEV